jgi:hypothetical protein
MELELIKENTWDNNTESYTAQYSVKLGFNFHYVGPDYDKALERYNKIKNAYQPPFKETLFSTTLQ